MIEVREAPVPVRWRWSELNGMKMKSHAWFDFDPCPIAPHAERDDAMTVELSNGQTVIVRAKK